MKQMRKTRKKISNNFKDLRIDCKTDFFERKRTFRLKKLILVLKHL